MCERKCPSESLWTFCVFSPPGPKYKNHQKVCRIRCECTAGDPLLDSLRASGVVDGASIT